MNLTLTISTVLVIHQQMIINGVKNQQRMKINSKHVELDADNQ